MITHRVGGRQWSSLWNTCQQENTSSHTKLLRLLICLLTVQIAFCSRCCSHPSPHFPCSFFFFYAHMWICGPVCMHDFLQFSSSSAAERGEGSFPSCTDLLTKAPLHCSPLRHLLKQWPLPTSCTSTFYYLAPWGSLLPWILLSWLQTITQMHRKWWRTEERTDKGFEQGRASGWD